MRAMRFAQRQVELRRLGNQLPVLGKANSLYAKSGKISLQPYQLQHIVINAQCGLVPFRVLKLKIEGTTSKMLCVLPVC